ncbi:hypothetical protein E2C01_046975 [Portunus trituberculatus]|uniref:Uncharacterized protein n=1 Tax=Portunus trituberculatus TaxID=210409 RepID=A0A5B7FZZ2_PORTR|nr:hypothetical protein [Portunus trituberculatus]
MLTEDLVFCLASYVWRQYIIKPLAQSSTVQFDNQHHDHHHRNVSFITTIIQLHLRSQESCAGCDICLFYSHQT